MESQKLFCGDFIRSIFIDKSFNISAMSIEINQVEVERVEGERSAYQLAKVLKRFLLIDIDVLLHNKQRKAKEQSKWLCYKLFVVIFLCVYVIRYIILATFKSRHIADSLGGYFRFFAKDSLLLIVVGCLFAVIPVMMGTFNGFMVERFSRSRAGMTSSLDIIHVISGRLPPEVIGLEFGVLYELRRRAKIGAFLSNYGFGMGCGLFFLYIPYLYVFNIDYVNYWWQLIIAKFMTDLYIGIGFGALITSLSFFYLVCHVLVVRLKKMNMLLARSIDGDCHLHLIIKMHNEIAESIYSFHCYWKGYLLSAYACYLPIISLFCYIAFVADVEVYVKVISTPLLLTFFALISFTCVSAGQIYAQVG